MQKKIVEFTNILRKAGVRVSVAQSIDAFLAVKLQVIRVYGHAIVEASSRLGERFATSEPLSPRASHQLPEVPRRRTS